MISDDPESVLNIENWKSYQEYNINNTDKEDNLENIIKKEIEILNSSLAADKKCITKTVIKLNTKLLLLNLEKRNIEKIYDINIDNIKEDYKKKSIMISIILATTIIIIGILLLSRS